MPAGFVHVPLRHPVSSGCIVMCCTDPSVFWFLFFLPHSFLSSFFGLCCAHPPSPPTRTPHAAPPRPAPPYWGWPNFRLETWQLSFRPFARNTRNFRENNSRKFHPQQASAPTCSGAAGPQTRVAGSGSGGMSSRMTASSSSSESDMATRAAGARHVAPYLNLSTKTGTGACEVSKVNNVM